MINLDSPVEGKISKNLEKTILWCHSVQLFGNIHKFSRQQLPTDFILKDIALSRKLAETIIKANRAIANWNNSSFSEGLLEIPKIKSLHYYPLVFLFWNLFLPIKKLSCSIQLPDYCTLLNRGPPNETFSVNITFEGERIGKLLSCHCLLHKKEKYCVIIWLFHCKNFTII